MDFQTSGPKSEANAEVTLAAIFIQVLYFFSTTHNAVNSQISSS